MANLAPDSLRCSFNGLEYNLPLGYFDTRDAGAAYTKKVAHEAIIKSSIRYMEMHNISVNMPEVRTWGEFVTQAINNGFSYISNG